MQRAGAARSVDTITYNQALVLGRLKRYEEAEQQLRSVPSFQLSEVNQGIFRCLQGDHAAGVQLLESGSAGKDQSSKLYYNRALAYLKLDRLPEASKTIDEAIRLRGNEPVYRLLKGDVLLTQGKHREALSQYRSLGNQKDVARLLPVRIGNSLLGLKKYEEAATIFEKYLQQLDRTHHFWACYGLASARYALKQFPAAVMQFRHATQLEPQSAAAHLGLGHAFCSQHDYKQARQEYETALQLKPNNSYAHLGLGVVSCKQGAYEESLEEFEKAGEAFNPKDPSLADCYLSRGLAQLEMGKNQLAMADFLTAINLNKDLPAAYAGVSDVYRKNENFLQAIRYMDKAVSLEPQNDKLLTNKGNLYLKVSNMDEAYPMFMWALRHNPRNVNALNGMGVALLERDHIERAQTLYDSLISRGHHKAYLYNNRGIVRSYVALKLEKAKDFHNSRQYFYRSLKDFEKAQKLDSSTKYYQNNLGNVYKNMQDFGNAIKSYESYLSKTAINNMGVLFASNSKGTISKHYLNIAIDLDSTNQIYHYNRYRVFNEFFKDSLHTNNDVARAGTLVLTNSISAKYSRDGYINIYMYDYAFDKIEFPGEHFFPILPENPPHPDFRPIDDLLMMDIKAERADSRVSPPIQVKSKRMPKPRRSRANSGTDCPKII
ncbi:tetratricopeptide repeat protein [Tellurirhabdus bombi]|uniref:tetratricopeptide repeat protein n=1 Tax=Tellurirhabdus bombi TaxID=2907205 RepID=UPI001F362F7B|nr:tetratricopeptide repeat protein [Tellurirhabdus bombi]